MHVRPARLSIGTWLMVIFGVVVTAVALGVPTVVTYQQNEAVHKLALSESRRVSQLVFDHLYSVMRKGWSRAEIDEIVGRINLSDPTATVKVWRGPKVEAEYGLHGPSVDARGADPLLRTVLDEGQDRLIYDGSGVRYLFPVKVEADCIACHTNVREGDVNGIIEVNYPTSQLRVPLTDTLMSAATLYIGAMALFFVLLFVSLRWLITRPIVDLSGTMTHIVEREDLGRRLRIRRLWPREMQVVARSFNALMKGLEESRQELLRQSVRDSLTGAYNRRRFDAVLRSELERARRYKRPLSVVLVDLDRFKPINDQHGHAAGDAVLKAVAAAMLKRLRTSDLVARIGGDEFAVVAPETDAPNAERLAEILSELVQNTVVPFNGAELRVGASCGPATLEPGCDASAEELLARADEAMYAIKQAHHAAR